MATRRGVHWTTWVFVALGLGAVVTVAVAASSLEGTFDFGAGSSDEELPEAAFRQVENDALFTATPENARIGRSARRSECADASGDVPATWRVMTSGLPDEAVLDFYARVAQEHGWAQMQRSSGGDVLVSAVSFERTLGSFDVQLRVQVDPSSDEVEVVASTPCPPHM